jgi:hypothetical protein
MIVFGVGLGSSMPLFMLAVQNAVPYKVMGVSTSTMQFLRSVGGTMGVAILFAIIQGQYHEGLARDVPPVVQQQPELAAALDDPQFLLDERALTQVQGAFQAFGEEGQALFDATMIGVRTSLADGISGAFFIAIFVLAASVVVALFMKEIPIRRTHIITDEGAAIVVEPAGADGPLPGAQPSLRPIEGAAPDDV